MTPDTGTPKKIPLPMVADDLVVGYDSTCARLLDGRYRCWGNNYSGKLGDGSPGTYGQHSLVISGVPGARQMAIGQYHACALHADGVRCYGDDSNGQLGLGTLVVSHVPVPVMLTDVAEISAGSGYTCARKSTGTPMCWGWNDFGQLGIGSFVRSVVLPTAMDSTPMVDAIEVGAQHTCAILPNKTAVCTGYNSDGQLGNNEMPPAYKPVAVHMLTGVAEISAGYYNTCARLAADGAVWCWGANQFSQLNDGTMMSRGAPVFTGITGARGVAVGYQHVCVRTASDGVQCFGNNTNGELGDGSMLVRTAPVTVIKSAGGPLTGVLELAAGNDFTCARTSGAVYCWGGGDAGQLGDGGQMRRLSAVQVTNLTDATQIAAGYLGACALRTGGTVECWGDNPRGDLGIGSTMTRSVPTPVMNVTDATQVSVGASHACARKNGGSAVCWGLNENGELGTVPTLRRPVAELALLSCP